MKRIVKSLFTDGAWDPDLTKVLGAVIIVCGFVGFFLEKPDAFLMVCTGAATIVSGKFSREG